MNAIAQALVLGLSLTSVAYAAEETPPLRDVIDHVAPSVASISVELSEPAVVSGVEGLTPVHFGDAHPLKRGDPIFFVGTPFGLRGSVLTGIISALRTTGGPFPHLLLQPSFLVQPRDDGAPCSISRVKWSG